MTLAKNNNECWYLLATLYVSYEQRSLSRGEKWRALFQDHTDKLILSEKKKHWKSKRSRQQSTTAFIIL